MRLTLAHTRNILDAALAKAAEPKLKPLAISVLDVRGALAGIAAAGLTGDTG